MRSPARDNEVRSLLRLRLHVRGSVRQPRLAPLFLEEVTISCQNCFKYCCLVALNEKAEVEERCDVWMERRCAFHEYRTIR